MVVCLAAEKELQLTHWREQNIRGIRSEAKRRGYDLCELKFDGTKFTNLPPDTKHAIVMSNSSLWINNISDILNKENVNPILISCSRRNRIRGASYVLMDYEEATFRLLDYLEDCGRRRVALFAVSPNSSTDVIKMDAFLHYGNGRFSPDDVFFLRENTSNTCDRFIKYHENFDAVIGTNDIITVLLSQRLAEVGLKVPDDVFMTTFGDMEMCKIGIFDFTTATLNCFEVGKQAVEAFTKLESTPELSNVSIEVSCNISVGASTANIPITRTSGSRYLPLLETPFDFLSDPQVARMFLVERVVSNCDPLDFEILRSLAEGTRYIDIAEMLHTSESTIKYRIKRLLNIAEINSRDELLDMMKEYIYLE